MKNITVSVDNEVYRRARVIAAEQNTSVSALVRQFLSGLASGERSADRLLNDERELRERIEQFRAADRLTREAVHDR